MNPTTDLHLLLIGGTDEAVEKAKKLGLVVLLVQHPTKISDRQRELADVLHVVDFTDWSLLEPIARELYATPGYRVALSLTEPGLEPAGRINDLFQLGGTSQKVAGLLRDKWAMRQLLSGTGRASVAAEQVTGIDSLTGFGERYGYPFIVKPADGTASIGVFKVETPQQCDEVWQSVSRLRGTRTDRVSSLFVLGDFIVEQYVEGPEFSVESFSFAGRHVIIAITEKFVSPTFAEVGHTMPARLSTGTRDALRSTVRDFLTTVGLRDGLGHTELRIGPDGPVVIEGHNRFGGDALPDLVRGAYGIDQATLALGWPFGLVPELPDEPVALGGAATRFLFSEPGRVESIEGVTRAQAEPDVLVVKMSVHPGDEVRPLRDNWDRVGLVAVTAADPSAALERSAEVIGELLRVTVTGDDGGTTTAYAAQINDGSHNVEVRP
ncbi:ATP-grasp domain-containing protein [Actinoplanes sp. NPDC051494]|uniref:ATP-grasp domain-containing protein n=1 Tax=Actinoplanes sp. NPDC051494 TaxID=3363907 RepID=UPI0037A3E049